MHPVSIIVCLQIIEYFAVSVKVFIVQKIELELDIGFSWINTNYGHDCENVHAWFTSLENCYMLL